MENVEFHQVSPQEISSEAIILLEQAASGFGGMLSVTQTLQNYDSSKDVLVEVKNATILLAAIHLTISHQVNGKVLTSVLLAGDNLAFWHEDLSRFYYKLAADHDCDEFMLMGREGFKHYFPELEEVARIFRVKLK